MSITVSNHNQTKMKHFLLVAAFIVGTLNLYAQANQCPGCAINVACNNPAANFPALCPAILPDGDAGQPYSQDVTFFMPYIIDASGFSGLNLEELTVLSISGIPSGLSWTTNHYASSPTNFYDITSDPNTQHGCAKICGTPLLPGSYTATVSVLVKICNIPIVGCSTMTQSLVLPLTINPPAGGNPYFSFNPSTGCGNVDVTFQGLLNLGLPQVTEYAWDFDNGNVSTDQNPAVQTYTTPGEFHPTLTTNVYDHVFNSMTANVTGGWWCGDFEELNCGAGNADIKFDLSHGSATYNGAEVTNTINPSWSNLGVVLSSMTIAVQFTEVDVVSASDNGGSFTMVLPGAGTYNFSTTAVTSGGGGVNGSFTITKQLFNAYVATDTINVYNLPALANITSSTGSFNMCSNSPIVLSVYEGYNYAWYENDTTLIVGADSSSYEVPVPSTLPYTANYKVKITDPATGCAIFTPNTSVTVNEGVPDLFGSVGALYFGGKLITNYSGFASYQWLLNGTPLVPSGQTQTYVPTANGNYSLVITSAGGCSDTSNVISIFNMGVDEMSGLDQFISVYPNPSNGEFTLNMTEVSQGSLTISIIDISGKAVYQEHVGQTTGTFSKTFNLQHLSSGIYTMNLQFDQGSVKRKLIIR